MILGELLSLEAIGEKYGHLGLTRNAAYRLVADGKVRYCKLGRKFAVPESELEEYVKSQVGGCATGWTLQPKGGKA